MAARRLLLFPALLFIHSAWRSATATTTGEGAAERVSSSHSCRSLRGRARSSPAAAPGTGSSALRLRRSAAPRIFETRLIYAAGEQTKSRFPREAGGGPGSGRSPPQLTAGRPGAAAGPAARGGTGGSPLPAGGLPAPRGVPAPRGGPRCSGGSPQPRGVPTALGGSPTRCEGGAGRGGRLPPRESPGGCWWHCGRRAVAPASRGAFPGLWGWGQAAGVPPGPGGAPGPAAAPQGRSGPFITAPGPRGCWGAGGRLCGEPRQKARSWGPAGPQLLSCLLPHRHHSVREEGE